MHNNEFTKVQLVTIVVAILNGDVTYVDREEVAIKVNDIAPGRFNWRKYPERIDLDAVSIALRSAKKSQNGGLIVGNNTKGWMLSPAGLMWIKSIDLKPIHEQLSVNVKAISISANQEVEHKRLCNTRAYKLFISEESEAIVLQDFYEFARVNEYFQTKARQRRYAIIANTVIDDYTLSKLWDFLQAKFPQEIR
ncbi:MAG: hypothetical protein OXD54_08920 [Candidatus Poribacteria bacterium]|nr:hypothetical protein [Candidatus Poribacteria bacterium]